MQDFAYFKSLYPAACKQMQLCVEAVCDEMEYEGSPIYDEYPDRLFLEKLTKQALEKWQKTGVPGEGTIRGTSIQPHLPGNDVWYGPLRGEQQGESGGYTVWEADEPNLTVQERRPWSPPPGPRPGGLGNPWGPPPPPPGPRPGGPGNPWGPPPPPPGPRPGGPGNLWGPPPGPRPGGTPFQDFLQVLLMNEIQERRRCRKC